MLVKSCYVGMTVYFTLEKDRKEYSVTAFPKVVSLFLQKDIFDYNNYRHRFPVVTKWKTNYKVTKTLTLTTMPINNFLPSSYEHFLKQ